MRKSPSDTLIEIPRTVWETAESKEELEDWLLAHDRSFLAEMRRIRREQHLPGKGKPLSEVARKWNIKL